MYCKLSFKYIYCKQPKWQKLDKVQKSKAKKLHLVIQTSCERHQIKITHATNISGQNKLISVRHFIKKNKAKNGHSYKIKRICVFTNSGVRK